MHLILGIIVVQVYYEQRIYIRESCEVCYTNCKLQTENFSCKFTAAMEFVGESNVL